MDLNQLRLFAAVAEAENFSKAALALGVPRSTVSRRVASLEQDLGVQLFNRSTRRVGLTNAGRMLFGELQPRLVAIRSALERLSAGSGTVAGRLRLTAPVDLGSIVLPDAVAPLLDKHPQLELEIVLSNVCNDLQTDGVDAALRVTSAAWTDASLSATHLSGVDGQVYAAPGYLRRFGTPSTVAEAAEHRWVGYVRKPLPAPLMTPRGGTVLMADDISFVCAALQQELGLGLLPTFVARAAVARGALVPVLPGLHIALATLYVVHPPMHFEPRRLAALREHLQEYFREHPLAARCSPI